MVLKYCYHSFFCLFSGTSWLLPHTHTCCSYTTKYTERKEVYIVCSPSPEEQNMNIEQGALRVDVEKQIYLIIKIIHYILTDRTWYTRGLRAARCCSARCCSARCNSPLGGLIKLGTKDAFQEHNSDGWTARNFFHSSNLLLMKAWLHTRSGQVKQFDATMDHSIKDKLLRVPVRLCVCTECAAQNTDFIPNLMRRII